ncbi:MAG: hypothetical protein ACHQ49_10300 [Elusimicrobiota bacterium]
MAEAREFKPLKDLGELSLGDRSILKFYVDEFKGHKYGSIRTFVTGETYSGPTKSGITMNARILGEAIPALEKLPLEPEALEDVELGRWPKKMGVELVARITIYKDTTGIDLREWVDEAEYKGWSKKGVRIPYKDLPKAIGYLREMKALVAKE